MGFRTMLMLLVILSSQASAEIIINEMMYAPNDDWGGQYNEWVELFNNGTAEASIVNWTIDGKKVSEGIVPAGGYVILAKNATKFQDTYGSPSIQASFTLTNTGKILSLTDENGTVADIFDYAPYAAENIAKNNNRSLERNASGWFESESIGGTPGRNNSIIFALSEAPQNETETTEPIQDNDSLIANTAEVTSVSTPLGPPEISVANAPESLRFGDYASLQTELFSGDSEYTEARIVAYVFSPSWISRDISRDETTIRNTPYESSSAARLYNISKNSTIYAVLPIFLKCNPDKKFSEGNYILRVRLYSYGGSWSPDINKDVTIQVSGENPLCTKEIVYVNVTTKTPAEAEPEKEQKETIAFFVDYPKDVILGENFTTNVTLRYSGISPAVLEVYSYIHDHEKLLSQGFDGAKWRSTWAANSQSLEIAPNETKEVALLNIPKNVTALGMYTYKIVMADMNSSKVLKEYTYLVRVNGNSVNETSGTSVSISINETEIPENAAEGISGQAILQQEKTSIFGRFWKWVRGIWS